MTSQREQVLLDRIAAFDKSPRQMTLDPDTTVIFYTTVPERGWIIDQFTKPGDLVLVRADLIPIAASPEEVESVLAQIPAPPDSTAFLQRWSVTIRLSDRSTIVKAVSAETSSVAVFLAGMDLGQSLARSRTPTIIPLSISVVEAR